MVPRVLRTAEARLAVIVVVLCSLFILISVAILVHTFHSPSDIVNNLVVVDVLSDEDRRHFDNPFSQADSELLERTLRNLASVLDENQVSYFINGGTLLGSLRHHDRIPWDDDVDIIVWHANRTRALSALIDLYPDYLIYNEFESMADGRKFHVKFSPADGHDIGHPFRVPFVDIFWFKRDSEVVRNVGPWFQHEVYRTKDVFPLRRRPFGRLMLPAPCNAPAAVQAVFGDVDLCRSRHWNHHRYRGSVERVIQVPCRELAQVVFFAK